MSFLVWAVIVLLILVNALYVAAEFAAVGVRRSQIHQLAQDGNKLAIGLLPILADAHKLDRYVAACQIGITLSSLILGAFGQATVALGLAALLERAAGMEALAAGSAAAAIVLVALTIAQVVFGELVPKSLALQFPSRVALLTYLPMRWSLAAYSWFIAFMNGSGLLILRLIGMPQSGHRHIHSPEEIEMLIAESRDGGLLEPEEQYRLHQALHLGRLTARQLMVPRRLVAALSLRTTPQELLRTAISSPYTRLLVYRNSIDDVIGMMHTKDLAAYYARTGRIPRVEALVRPIIYVPTTITIDRLLTTLRSKRTRMAAVLDEHGGLEGIVTLEDVLSELVGDVADEFKGDHPVPETLADGRVRFPGSWRLDEAGEMVGVDWSNEEASTIGGLVIDELGVIPVGGERLFVGDAELEVEQVDGQTILSIIVSPPRPESVTRLAGPETDRRVD